MQPAIPVGEHVVEHRDPRTPTAPRGLGEVEPETIDMAKWDLKGIMPEMPVSDVAAPKVNIVDPLAAHDYGMKDFAITDPDGDRLPGDPDAGVPDPAGGGVVGDASV